ncbi:MAG: methyltransferase domain-containing protein [Planctomycetota bacterium]
MTRTPRIAALVASRNRPDLVDAMVERLRAQTSLPIDFHVVECGTEPDQLSRCSTLWYRDEPFRGKCYGHNLALDAAKLAASQDEELRANGGYDYYWVLMNDVVFDDGVDAARILVETMEREPRLAILSPTNQEGGYPGAERRANGGFRKVTTCDYLGFMMKREAVEEAGFLNPAFTWCWGAIHELAYRCYSNGWFVAYSDDVAYRHLGGSTYGRKGTNTVSREEYQRNAKAFATEYFVREYGEDWNERFFAATRGHQIEVDTFTEHRAYWSDGAWSPRSAAPASHGPSRESQLLVPDDASLARLHLGCGSERREGWINVDTNPQVSPDVVADAFDLHMLGDASIDVIEANHLFEHMTYDQALAALREWRRVLKPSGELYLELPDLEACIRILGRYTDDRGYDMGLGGMYGWPPLIAEQGAAQIHKWGWTRSALGKALADAGFANVAFGPISQTWRQAAKVGRDMRVRATVAAAAASPSSAPSAAPCAQSAPTAPERPAEPAPHDAAFAIFAWPDYGDPNEVAYVFSEFARHLTGRAGFLMRYDPTVDGPRERVVQALDEACARTLGTQPVDVVLVEHPLDAVGWRQIGDMVEAAVVLPSSARPERRIGLAHLRTRYVSKFEQLAGGSSNAA